MFAFHKGEVHLACDMCLLWPDPKFPFDSADEHYTPHAHYLFLFFLCFHSCSSCRTRTPRRPSSPPRCTGRLRPSSPIGPPPPLAPPPSRILSYLPMASAVRGREGLAHLVLPMQREERCRKCSGSTE
jgi:hypothetical protein